jgi:hypothetical protein
VKTTANAAVPADLGALLRGEVLALATWTAEWRTRQVMRDVTLISLGAGLFGSALGSWHGPVQAVYAGLKLPLILLLTASGNALLNAMLAPLLGLRIALRQSFLAILSSFALAATILGGLSPLAAFVIWNAPPLAMNENDPAVHSGILLLLVAAIAFSGIVANLRLLQLLRNLSEGQKSAVRVLLSWLTVNLFLGSQLSWALRPFIGSPTLPVEFLRADAFNGNFFEAVIYSTARLLH